MVLWRIVKLKILISSETLAVSPSSGGLRPPPSPWGRRDDSTAPPLPWERAWGRAHVQRSIVLLAIFRVRAVAARERCETKTGLSL